jgi:hypothetical protein
MSEPRPDATTAVVATFANRFEAESARALLESHGIGAMIVSNDAGGWRPDLAHAGLGTRLVVLEDNLARARTVLESPDAG